MNMKLTICELREYFHVACTTKLLILLDFELIISNLKIDYKAAPQCDITAIHST